MRNRYFEFLCGLVDEYGKTSTYVNLLEELHNIEFYSLIPNDDNRAQDGIQLRERFLDEEGQHALSFLPGPDEPCTVLEMLVGLSFRLEFETIQSRWEKTPSEWFWILIDNLGLVSDHQSVQTIRFKVSIFLDRRYSDDGHGGLFPLKYPKKDQRDVEIWYQMTAYIVENYPI